MFPMSPIGAKSVRTSKEIFLNRLMLIGSVTPFVSSV